MHSEVPKGRTLLCRHTPSPEALAATDDWELVFNILTLNESQLVGHGFGTAVRYTGSQGGTWDTGQGRLPGLLIVFPQQQ